MGGHAVNFYGLSRQTGDIDFLVRVTDKNWWRELLTRLTYRSTQDDNRFARFRPSELGGWPIDLMFVDEMTFKKLDVAARAGTIGVADVRVVSPEHLATLKIHALKHYQEHRYAKDYNDLLWLLRSGKACLSRAELEELCKQYASGELYLKLVADLETQ